MCHHHDWSAHETTATDHETEEESAETPEAFDEERDVEVDLLADGGDDA